MTDGAAARAEEGVASRRMRRITMLTAFVAISPLGMVAIAITSESRWETLALGVGLLATFPILTEWSIDTYPRRSAWALSLAGIAWLLCALLGRSPLGFFALALAGAIVLARLPRRRILASVGLSLGIALLGATALLTQPPTWALADRFIVIPAAGTLFVVSVVMLSERSWLLVRRLERAKEAEAELAIARERMRFAGDLHDIQGHTLHVIKLKAALAQRFLTVDTDRANTELEEVRRLISDTIDKTRELAYARHELNLSTELENARLLCEAAGIEVHAHLDGNPTTPAHPLLAHVLREATTNLLRHAQPTQVTIAATSRRVEITNDGVIHRNDHELRGLARLRERIELAGGELHISRSPDCFTVSAELAAPNADAGPVWPTTGRDEETR